MDLVKYAENEIARIPKDEDNIQEVINRDILKIVKAFSEQRHSRTSAEYALSMLERLLRFKPISPLTGADDEWDEILTVRNGVRVYQNKCCFSVLKEVDAQGNVIMCKDIDKIIVSDDGGFTWFSSNMFNKDITFPYFPPIKPEEIYIECIEKDKFEVITDKPERIKDLYDKKCKKFGKEAM